MNTLEINSLSEFIQSLEKINSNNFVFRGESDFYPEILASVLRKTGNTYYNFKKLYDDYYREIAFDLTEIERENFLAYSQHHGLPTPLIDISNNPLVALYFACSSSPSQDTGYVYAMNKNKCIPFEIFDTSNFNLSYNLSSLAHPKNQINFILYLDENQSLVKELLLDLVQKILLLNERSNMFTPLFKSINDTAKALCLSEINTFEELERLILKLEEDKDIISIFEKILKFFESIHKKDDLFPCFYCIRSDNGQTFTYQSWWTSLISTYIHEYSMLDVKVRYHKDNNFTLIPKPLLPNILFKTEIIFERIRSQDGIFLYQLNDTFLNSSLREPITQQIIKDKTFIIKNKKNILRQLDSIGINRKNLFLDHDSVAEYLSLKQVDESNL